MMLRQLSIASISLAAALICIVTDCPSCEAQGLLRRIQNRIESRLQPVPPAQTRPQTQPPRQPRYAPAAQRVEPQGNRSRLDTSGPAAVDASKYGSSILSREPELTVGLGKTSASDRPSLGIFVLESRSGTPGLQVASIRSDSLADEAGLKEGDLIVAIDGKPTPSIANITHHFDGLKTGDRIRATIVRGRTTQSIMIPLVSSIVSTARPELSSPKQDLPHAPIEIGITVEEADGVRGLIVTDVAANSPAADAGLISGDRIVSVDGRLLASAETLNRELESRSLGEQLSLQLVRNGNLIVADVGSSGAGGLAKPDSPTATDETNSVLEGFGSMLGGLLGGKADLKKADSPQKGGAKVLSDQSKVQQAGFESETQRAKKTLQGDPPSLRTLELPADEPGPLGLKAPEQTPSAEETIKALREEIRRLEQRLNELQADN